jgi:hypothetical protein
MTNTTTTTTTTQANDIKERIRRLLALAESANINEAANAAAKASELLHKYNLQIEDIPVEGEAVDEYGVVTVDYEGQSMWRRSLLESIARANNSRTVYVPGTTKGKIVGREHEQEITLWIYTYLAGELQRIAKREYKLTGHVVPQKTWYASFYMGAVRVIAQRFRELRKSTMEESSKSTALVLNRDALAVQAMNRLVGRTHEVNSRSNNVNTDAYRRGQAAGANIGLNRPITGNRFGRKQLAG